MGRRNALHWACHPILKFEETFLSFSQANPIKLPGDNEAAHKIVDNTFNTCSNIVSFNHFSQLCHHLWDYFIVFYKLYCFLALAFLVIASVTYFLQSCFLLQKFLRAKIFENRKKKLHSRILILWFGYIPPFLMDKRVFTDLIFTNGLSNCKIRQNFGPWKFLLTQY